MMPKRYRQLGWLSGPLLSMVAIALCSTGPSLAEEGYVGSETCAMCHEDVAADFTMTAHAVAPGWDPETGCEACHGPGAEHVDSGGEIDLIARPSEMTPREQSDACLTCHIRQERQFTARHSVHKLSDVSCIDCHQPHSTAKNLLDKSGAQLCRDCHQAIVAQFDLPRAHPLAGYPRSTDGSDDGCAGCHDPHTSVPLRVSGRSGPALCLDCHTDKNGPFVYGHDATLVDGCGACHQVHGSPNRHLLNASRQVNLCYQCHPGTVTPGFHSAPAFLNEKCTACHTAIHGSNTNPFFLEE